MGALLVRASSVGATQDEWIQPQIKPSQLEKEAHANPARNSIRWRPTQTQPAGEDTKTQPVGEDTKTQPAGEDTKIHPAKDRAE